MFGHSRSIGSFTFMIISLSRHVVAASGAILAPTAVNASSGNPLPRPAPVSINTECPAPTSDSAPAGTRAMRFSLVLISLGTPIFIVASGWKEETCLTGAWKVTGAELQSAFRTQAHYAHLVGIEELPRHARHVFHRDRVDQREELVERAIGLAVQLH